METLWTDSIPESSGAHQFVEDLTTAVDGVGGGEQLATTAGDSTEMLGATAGVIESLEVGAGAADIMPKSGA